MLQHPCYISITVTYNYYVPSINPLQALFFTVCTVLTVTQYNLHQVQRSQKTISKKKEMQFHFLLLRKYCTFFCYAFLSLLQRIKDFYLLSTQSNLQGNKNLLTKKLKNEEETTLDKIFASATYK